MLKKFMGIENNCNQEKIFDDFKKWNHSENPTKTEL